MKKNLLIVALMWMAMFAFAQDPSTWTKGQDVTAELQWQDYDCSSNESGAWQSKGEHVDFWTSPCFELYSPDADTNPAGTEIFQIFYLPAGVYDFHMKGFYRHGDGRKALKAYDNGEVANGATLFVETGLDAEGNASENTLHFDKQVADLYESLSTSSLFARTEQWWDDGDQKWTDKNGNIYYFPACQRGCIAHFEQGLADNAITIIQAQDGYVRIGVRKNITLGGNTVDFGFFTATYKGEASAELNLMMVKQQFDTAVNGCGKNYSKYYNSFVPLALYYQDELSEINDEYSNSETEQKFYEGIDSINSLTARYDAYFDIASQMQHSLLIAEGVAASTSYPGIDAFKAAVAKAKAVLEDGKVDMPAIVNEAEDYATAAKALQQARVDYAMSQEKLANGSWDFSSLVAYPFFVNMDCNPTVDPETGLWVFPAEVNRDQVKITNGNPNNIGNEYWYCTDASGWRGYGLAVNADAYCAQHWAQQWDDFMDLAQNLGDLPNGYYSIGGYGMPGLRYMVPQMWMNISSSTGSSDSKILPPHTGFYEGASPYDWNHFETGIVQVTDGNLRICFRDHSDNNLAFTGMQLFYYGENPDFSLIIDPMKAEVLQSANESLELAGDRKAVEDMLNAMPAKVEDIDAYNAALADIEAVKAYISTANNFLSSHDLTAIYSALGDEYAEDNEASEAITTALFYAFDVYDLPEATYKDIEVLYNDYLAYKHYFEMIADYKANASDELKALIAAQTAEMAADYKNAEKIAKYESALAEVSNKDFFSTLDLKNASEDNPVDVTSLIKNASFEKGAAFWTGNADFDGSFAACQAYNYNFYAQQTIYSVPAGKYEVRMQGLYRDGSIEKAFDHVYFDTDEGFVPNMKLYANNDTVDVVSIANFDAVFPERTFTEYTYTAINPETEMEETLRGWLEETEEGTVYKCEIFNDLDVKEVVEDGNSWYYDLMATDGLDDYYFPNSTRGASIRFKNDKGAYENKVVVELQETGSLTIGVRKDVTIEGDWCAFDNFRLYYIGAASVADGITDACKTAKAAKAYTLDGRATTSLQKGVNIVRYSDGSVKKVLVK